VAILQHVRLLLAKQNNARALIACGLTQRPRTKQMTRRTTMHPNVLFVLLFTFISNLALGVWAYVILSAFLQELEGGSNTAVGLAEAIQGVSNVVTAVPAGIVADRCKRQTGLFLATCVGLIAVALASITLTLNTDVPWLDDHRYAMLCVVLAFFGGYQGLCVRPSFRFTNWGGVHAWAQGLRPPFDATAPASACPASTNCLYKYPPSCAELPERFFCRCCVSARSYMGPLNAVFADSIKTVDRPR
jgi:hypothetical protein